MKSKSVIFSLIMLVAGFLISFSYQLTKEQQVLHPLSTEQWEKEYKIRNDLIQQEEKNRSLQQELYQKQEQVRQLEEDLKNEKQIYFNLVEDVEKYRMFTGEVGVAGAGVQVTLDDSSYIPEGENVNNYIVHESHVFKVVNELLIAGASAVSINGQRLSHNSYIFCNGPVITVDGNQFPAPFVISAIGDPDVLVPALNISGGTVEQLAFDNIVVTLEKRDSVVMNPLLRDGNSS
ncbi:DUF881 domain-containing protein [Bacillus lacus]|uniref:DUF881 domain-containing protein n=1 Tax=Metabacillus lacus TaxID=1983721 RepID=A0A7X2LYN0_9BACI|nr:DUF881 domain-containing protein [Metabacillus lacus]MRX70804.1 DUF881 domain-containing protein [Metabacillus lacus]